MNGLERHERLRSSKDLSSRVGHETLAFCAAEQLVTRRPRQEERVGVELRGWSHRTHDMEGDRGVDKLQRSG